MPNRDVPKSCGGIAAHLFRAHLIGCEPLTHEPCGGEVPEVLLEYTGRKELTNGGEDGERR